MYNLYETIKSLCDEKEIKPGKMCVEANISKGLISDLKAGRKKTIRVETAQKIADYFGVTVDRVLGAPAENAQKETAAPKGDGLSPLEAQLMEYIRRLTDDQKKMLLAQIELLLSKQESLPDSQE